MNKLTVIALTIVLLFPSFNIGTSNNAYGDDKTEAAKWVFLEKDNISSKGCFIELSNQGKYVGHGSGTLISVNNNKKHPKNKCLVEAIVVTCNHVTPERSHMVNVKWQDGTTSRALVIARDTKTDIAILKTWVKAGTVPASLNILPVKRGELVRCFGYGGITDVTKPRYFQAEVLNHDINDSILINEDVVPGDSGGGIFNQKGQLIGIIAHGNSRFKQVNNITYTPIGQGSTASLIIRLLNDYIARQSHFHSE